MMSQRLRSDHSFASTASWLSLSCWNRQRRRNSHRLERHGTFLVSFSNQTQYLRCRCGSPVPNETSDRSSVSPHFSYFWCGFGAVTATPCAYSQHQLSHSFKLEEPPESSCYHVATYRATLEAAPPFLQWSSSSEPCFLGVTGRS